MASNICIPALFLIFVGPIVFENFHLSPCFDVITSKNFMSGFLFFFFFLITNNIFYEWFS